VGNPNGFGDFTLMVSPTARAALFAQDTAEGLLVLLTVDHADLVEPIRVTANHENIVSNGNLFIGVAFDIELPGEEPDSPPVARLTIDNVTREIAQTIRSINTPADVTIEVVRMADPDTIELNFLGFKLRNTKVDAMRVTGDLLLDNLMLEPYPADIYSPASFPGLIQ